MVTVVDITLDAMHCSMQFTDSTAQKQHDAQAIFARAAERETDWVTGTEAGLSSSDDLRTALQQQAKLKGYRFNAQADLWTAVRRENVQADSWTHGFVPVLPANSGTQKHNARGILWMTWKQAGVGTISVGVSHYMTHGHTPGDEYYQPNIRLTKAIAKWGREHGSGKKLAFFAGDTNISDRNQDVFRGAPFTTLADELKQWEDTGHGSIDVIASYDADGRVKAKYWRALDDKEFPLNTDHYACEGGFTVRA